MLNIVHDDRTPDEDVAMLAGGLQQIVIDALGDKDVFVYINKPFRAIGNDPIEVFIQVNSHKVPDAAGLVENLSATLRDWKQQNSFAHPVNLNINPVEWFSEIGV